MVGGYGNVGKYVAISDDYNDRYTLSGVADIIGADKLKSIVEQFEGLISVELHREKQKVEEELSKYTIIKKDAE